MPELVCYGTFESLEFVQLGGVALAFLLADLLHLLGDGLLHLFEGVPGDDDLLVVLVPFGRDLHQLGLHELQVAGELLDFFLAALELLAHLCELIFVHSLNI